MTLTVHLAIYDTLSDWEAGYATAHINNGAWQREPGRYRGGPWARRSIRSPPWAGWS